MIQKPFFRIYRPFSPSVIENGGMLFYAEDSRYCGERMQLIRMFKMLQLQVIETFQYVEPVHENRDVFSLRYHQLYGNICAEIETNFRGILKSNGYAEGNEKNWNICADFHKTNTALKLNEYKIESYLYEISNCTDACQPFSSWNSPQYTALPWYQEHNAVKHDRTAGYSHASLKNVVTSLAGLYILLFAQFGYLVDAITTNGVILMVFDDGHKTTARSDMGYNITQQPSWNEADIYGFEWESIKENSNPYQCFTF